ncbi:MAG: hypothetical protein A2176_00035 [Spirochaetes bacterium RBG_13_51_14]|nr:MAG: hypothetical protein A2176_00035 [Spirochaetes bacterium RBG_13_51_14]
MFLIAFFSSNGAFGIPGDSGTCDEIMHIPAGYTYIKDLDFRLNPEHPPLAKALSGVFMVLAGIAGPENDDSWNSIDQLKAGKYMIYKDGNSAEEVFFWARLPMMLLMIGLGIFLYKWAVRIYGLKIGLVVLTLFAFYPDIIAHGRLVTTDIAAAFGYVITIYYFDKAITEITWKNIIFAGMAFAVAQLCKMSALLLFGILFLLVVVKAVMDKEENKKLSTSFWIYFKPYLWICLISFVFVWMVYILFIWGTPVEIEHRLIENILSDDPRTLTIRNFFHMFEGSRITMALGHYLLGVAFTIGRVILGNFIFILGHFSMKTISWYFPVAWLLKTPITIIILFLSSIGYIIIRFPKEKKDRWTIALIVMPIAVYWAFALIGSLNIGIRHLIPTVPFVLLLIGFFCKKIYEDSRGITAPKITVFVLMGYLIISTVSYYPNFIAYFNEATPRDARYTRLVDSSLDWGQDLLRLKKYVEDNNIKNIKLDYFGTSEPNYHIPDAQTWDSEYGPTTGWLAISALYYQASKLRGELYGKWSYHWLDSRKPAAIIGGSILVFDIDKDELTKNPAQSPYKITNVVETNRGRKDSLFWDLLEYFFKHLK